MPSGNICYYVYNFVQNYPITAILVLFDAER